MDAPVLSFRRKLFFAAVLTLALVVVLLGLLEAGLRLGGYGYSPHFARREKLPDGETVWRDNRWCTAPYFSPELVRRPQPFRLPLKKAPGTYRIFVLGSSAAMGDPEPSFSLSRMLEVMLRAAYPERRFEVVNAGITAINSHVVRSIAADCAELEPDLFIVYEGNNEVIGPFGPAGVFAPFLRSETAVRTAAWLKGTRTGQLIAALARRISGKAGTNAEWGGMEMFLQQQIAAGDPRLEVVRTHFRQNLRAIAASAHRAGAATLLCTVPTNQRDFAPFLSQHKPGLAAAELKQWNDLVDGAGQALRAGDVTAAETGFRHAYAIDDRHADEVFRFGRLALQNRRPTDARDLFQRALDLDTLRFRTDSSLNQVIRDLGSAGAPGLEMVDLASALAAQCTDGIAGDEVLYEHVHLNFRGTYEAARELFPRIAADLARRGLAAGAAPKLLDLGETRTRLGYNGYEQAMIAQELVNRFQRPPFTGQSDHAFRLAGWQKIRDSAAALLARPEAGPALRELARQSLALNPDDWILARNLGAMFVARQAPEEALPLLQRAAAWIDDDVDTLVALGWAQRALGRPMEADAAFARARALEPRYPNLPKADAPAAPAR